MQENNFNQNSGGIIVYVNKKHKIINVNEIMIDYCNCLSISLGSNGTAHEVTALYRAHRNNFTDIKTKLSEIVSKITADRVFILGDMNINISPESNDELKVDYLNLMAQMGFVSCINEYTRVNNNSATTIDHIFIKNSCTSNIRPIILESCITDITLLLEKNCKTIKSEIPNEKTNIDIKILRSLLAKEKWEIIFEKNDVDNCANNLHNILNNLIINSNKIIEK